MSSDVFWSLTLWDWSLWMEKIVIDRKRESDKQEFEWQRLSYLQALLVNITPLKDKRTYSPTDFYIPSWHKEIDIKNIAQDTRTLEQINELKKSLDIFPKKLPK